MLPLAALAAVILGLYYYWAGSRKPRASNNAFDVLPWVGFPSGLFGKLRGPFVTRNLEATMHEAYIKYGLNDIAFIAPSFMWPARIVLPPSMLPWILRQPDDVLNFGDAVSRALSFDVTSLDPLVMGRPSHPAAVRGPLTRSLAWTPQPLFEEIQASFARVWGAEREWKKVNLFDTLLAITAQTSNRIFLSSEICRDEAFLEATLGYANSLATCGTLLRPLPAWLRRSTSWLLLASHRRHFQRLLHQLKPLIEHRKNVVLQRVADPSHAVEGPDDLLMFLVESAHELRDPQEWSTDLIAKRYGVVMFAALHTTSWTMCNLLMNMLSADPKYNLIPTLRAEIVEVDKEIDGRWSKASLARLVHLDSALRESMRLHTLLPWSLHRLVVSEGGVDLPNGINIPRGTAIMVSGQEIMRDDANYPNGSEYDPFRFSRDRATPVGPSEATTLVPTPSKPETKFKARVQEAVTFDDTYFSFGHGKHACPGRFFVAQQIKLVMVHLLLTYEMGPLSKRPPEVWLGSDKCPDFGFGIPVRVR